MLIVVSYFLRFEFRLTSRNNHRVISITCLTFLSSIFFIFFIFSDVRATLIKVCVFYLLEERDGALLLFPPDGFPVVLGHPPAFPCPLPLPELEFPEFDLLIFTSIVCLSIYIITYFHMFVKYYFYLFYNLIFFGSLRKPNVTRIPIGSME